MACLHIQVLYINSYLYNVIIYLGLPNAHGSKLCLGLEANLEP
jgi:hypothetical protein